MTDTPEVNINGNPYALYAPRQEYLTPDDHTEINNLKKRGTNVAVDASKLEHLTSSDARQLIDKNVTLVNPKPVLELQLNIYSNKGYQIKIAKIGQNFDESA